MDVNVIPTLKQQKVLLYSPEGESQECPVYSLADEDQFSINCLELWKSVGFQKIPAVDDNYLAHSRRQQIDSADSDNTNVVQKSLEEVQKAALELAQIVQLTSLLKANEHLTLQTCFQAEIQDRGLPLPVLQSIKILKDNVSACRKRIVGGLESSRTKVQKRRIFAESLVELRKYWKLVYVDKNLNRVPVIDWTSGDQTVAVDCSVIPGDKLNPSLGSQLVPLVIRLDGIAVADSDLLNSSYTLNLSLNLHHSNGSVTSVCSVSAWEVDNQLQSGSELSSSSSSSSSASAVLSHVAKVHSYCVRRRHSALFWSIFSRMNRDCVEAADCWVSHKSDSNAAVDKKSISTELANALLTDKLTRSLKVVSISERSFTVMVSHSLSVTFSMVPLPDMNADSSLSKHGNADVNQFLSEWFRGALTGVILHSQSCLLTSLLNPSDSLASAALQSSSTVDLPLRELEDLVIAKNHAARLAQAQAQAATAAAAAASAAKAVNQINRPLSSNTSSSTTSAAAAGPVTPTTEVNVSLRTALQLLRSRINYNRVNQTMAKVVHLAEVWSVPKSAGFNALSFSVSPLTTDCALTLCERWQFILPLAECKVTVGLEGGWNYLCTLSCESVDKSHMSSTVANVVDPAVYVPVSSLASTARMTSFCRPLNDLAIANSNDLLKSLSAQVLGSYFSLLLQNSVHKCEKKFKLRQWSPLVYTLCSDSTTLLYLNVYAISSTVHVEISAARLEDRQACQKVTKSLKIDSCPVGPDGQIDPRVDCVGVNRWSTVSPTVSGMDEDLQFIIDPKNSLLLIWSRSVDGPRLFDSLLSLMH